MSDKDDVFTFRIEGEAKEKFAKICKDNFTTPSQTFYSFVHQTIRHSGKKISLQEYKERK